MPISCQKNYTIFYELEMMIHERTNQIRGFLKECHPVAEANKEYMQLEYEASSHAKKTSAMLRLVQCPFCCKYCFFLWQ